MNLRRLQPSFCIGPIRKMRRLAALLADRRFGEALLERHPVLGELDDDLEDGFRAGENVLLTAKHCIKISRPDAGFLIEHERRVLDLLSDYPYFPKVVACFREGATSILVTERLPGRELATIFRLSERQKEIFARDAFSITEVLGREGVRHRDITPRNLRLGSDRLHLVDFEFATLDGQGPLADSEAGFAYLNRSTEMVGGRWRSDSDRGSFELIGQEIHQKRTWKGLLAFGLTRTYRRFGV